MKRPSWVSFLKEKAGAAVKYCGALTFIDGLFWDIILTEHS
jgi:hypothetical protein